MNKTTTMMSTDKSFIMHTTFHEKIRIVIFDFIVTLTDRFNTFKIL